jgi:amino acid adenylation domain-containing protein
MGKEGCQAFRASSGQSRLWFLQQLQPGLTAYHMPALWGLSGDLDLPALEQALGDLVARHSTLRTSFCLQDKEVMQIIHPPSSFSLTTEPLADRNPDHVIQAWLQQERSTPFDLTAGLLLRARLLAVDEQHHLLLINHHHIASDGWSLSVLTRDLSELYNALRSGRSPDLQPLAVHYHDYAAWQRQRLSGDRLQKLKDFWIHQLTGLQPLELQTDHPRPVTPSYRGENLYFQIEPNLLEPFEELCRGEGATLQMGLLAVVALLLHRYSSQEDFAIGVPIWGRNHPELENLIGFFINTLPLRTRFQANQTFRDLLRQVKEASIAAYDHQELPFEQMVEALQVERDTSRNPLVQVMLQLMELPEAGLEQLDGLAVQSLPTRRESAHLDLSFYLCRSADQGLSASITYATDLFDGERIERLTGHLLTLLGSALESPDAAMNALNLLPEAERQLIESWQQGPVVEVPELCVHELFEQQVERTPEAIALVFEDQQLTYSELNDRANQLAHLLIDLGVDPEVIVALCLERSLELIISLLAILKAGGAYLPLDPAWPVERQHLLLDEAGCTLLLTAEGPEVIHSPHPVRGAVSGPPLAYITYTSGSTGIPKGVAVGHPSIVRLVNPVNGYQLSAGHRVLQLAPMAFDASTLEIWGPLLNGGTLVIAPPGQLSLQELAEVLRQGRITTVWLTAGLFHAMVESELEALAGVRQVLAGGDVLSPEHVQRLLDAFPPGHGLINGYGPTENTTFTCCHRLAAGDTVDPAGVPLGRPIALTSLQVLGPSGQPCPIGIPGELHIGGAGLARGYLNNPGLTAEKFIPDPFSSDPTARLYKSGDLASWNPDGTLVFHGRLDEQIKLRGFRIEPGEIEAVLIAHPAIKQAVVLLKQDQPFNPQLVAYWIPADAAAGKTADYNALSASELRPFLARSLPDYMVPAAFVVLESFPLTPNGKLDRKALPAPSFSGDLQQRVEPSTELELQLHALWAEVLGHSDFGITDNFFLMGGHSLAATRLVSRIEQTLGSAPPLAALFHNPTIAALEPLLHASSGNADRNDTHLSTLIPLQTGGTKPPLFVMPSYGGHPCGLILWPFLDAQQPVYSFMSRGLDGKQIPHTRLEDMAADYVRDMRTLQTEGPYFISGFSFGTRLAFEVAQQLYHQRQQVAFLALIDSAASLSRAPSRTAGDSPPLLSVKEASLFAFQTYIPQYYAGKITLFRAEESIYNFLPEGTGGWGELALGGIEIHDFPGPHTPIGLARQILGEKLRICLEKAQAIAFQSPRRPQKIFLAEQDYSPMVAQDTPLYYRYLSREYLKNADLEQEISSYQKAIKLDPRQPDWVYLNLGDALIEEGRLDEAITIYHDGLMFHPFNPRLFESLSAAQAKGGDSEQALNCWKEAIALNPALEFRNVYNQDGDDLRPERLTMALSAYQEAVSVHSRFLANIYKNLGLVQSQNGELKKAIASYRQGISLSPEFVPLYISLGWALIKEGKLEEAFDTFQEVIGLDSHREEAYLGLGNLRRQQGNVQEALVNFQKAVELNPNHAGANKGLGDCFLDLGKVDEAITAYGIAIQISPNNLECYIMLALAERQQGNVQEAIVNLRKVVELNPNHAGAKKGLGDCFQVLGKVDEAITAYGEAIQISPNYPECYIGLALAERQQGNVQEAIVNLQKAVELNPNHAGAKKELGDCFLDLGKVDEAITAYGEAIQISPNNPECYIMLALAERQQGNVQEAIVNLQKAVELNPNHAGAKKGLGDCFQVLGKVDEAVIAYGEAIQISPNNPECYIGLALAERQQGNVQEAIVNLQKAVELNPNHAGAKKELEDCFLDLGGCCT